MSDIAERAGVSRATVSLVLSGKYTEVGIAEDTRRRVLDVAEEMGYRTNRIARAMVTGSSRMLGFLVYNPRSEVAARILAGALEAAEAQGYSVKVISFFDSVEKVFRRCVELRLEGVMALYGRPEDHAQLHDELFQHGIPFAVLDSSFPEAHAVRILTDDLDGCRQAVEHLADLGHTRIAFIAGARNSGASVLREEGYRLAMARRGLPVPDGAVAYGEWNIAKTEAAVRQMLARAPGECPTALFCADDKMGVVAARTAASVGVRVPDDLSVVGYADLEVAVYGTPPLTTVAQPFEVVGATAIDYLVRARRAERRPGANPAARDVKVAVRLVLRASTAPPAVVSN